MKKYTKLNTTILIRGNLRYIFIYKINCNQEFWTISDKILDVIFFREYLCEKI